MLKPYLNKITAIKFHKIDLQIYMHFEIARKFVAGTKVLQKCEK